MIGKLKAWFPIGVFAILWLDLWRQLSYEWQTNEQYAYGWFVPILAVSLFLKKWPTRPVPWVSARGEGARRSIFDSPGFRSQPHSALSSPVASAPPSPVSSPFLLSIFIFLLCLFLFPLRVVHEINQDWSLCSFLLTLTVAGLSLYAVFLMGGWPWVKHFAFPICFTLVAVNWPNRIENSLKYRLMNAVAGLTVELAGWLNIPALQHGNVIQLSTGPVGVEDACSGIRSLQSTIMAGWFLGEFYLLRWPQRFLLLALGPPLAFFFNIIRTLFLTWQASMAGEAAISRWHDSAGITISVVCLGCLWLIAVLMVRRQKPAASSPGVSGAGESRPVFSPALVRGRWSVAGSPRAFMLACGLWTLCVIAFTEAWYRAHETRPR